MEATMSDVMQDAAPYPRELVRTITLKDGFSARLRPIRPDDEPRLVDLYERLSRHTAYQRFFTVLRRLPSDWYHFFANVDYVRRLALVVERETVAGVQLIGAGRYEPAEEPDTAEVASQHEAQDPQERARHVVEEEVPVPHAADAGHERGEGPHDGHEPRDHDGLGPVALVELVGALEMPAVEEPHAVAPEHARADRRADRVVHAVAQDRRGAQQRDDEPQV